MSWVFYQTPSNDKIPWISFVLCGPGAFVRTLVVLIYSWLIY